MVRREKQDDLCATSDKVASSLLGLHSAEEAKKVEQHKAMGQLRTIVNFPTILRGSGEREDIVEIEMERTVHVVDQGLDVRLEP